ncbi:MAG: flavodoxin family protein [Dehalococcoidales bacterium]|nr:flavodoxin family protein [Dehalococcoidales bacterium]
MKAIGIVGSPRKAGNTEILTAHTLKAIAEEGINTELIRLSGLSIKPCNACRLCREGKQCPIDDDVLPIYRKMKRADAIILASPVYFGSATALMKAFIERTGYMSYDKRPFAGKVGGPLVIARRAGKNFTFAEMMFWFQIMGMIVPGSTYWNVAIGRDKGEVANDEEGMATARNFGKNVAFLVKKLKS